MAFSHNRLILPIDKIINEYISGYSLRSLANKYNTDKGVIKRRLLENNICIRSLSDANKKYHFNEHLFDNIDSHEKAYWLGFIAADGNIYNNTIKIGLSEKDKDHLFKFKSFLNASHPVKTYPIQGGKYYSSQIAVKSCHMVKKLEELNILPQKSLTLKPSNIIEEYNNSYILGLMDGDGCFNIMNKPGKKSQFRISFVGSKEICEFIKESLLKIDVVLSKISKHRKIYQLQVSGNKKTKKIINYLYKDSPVWLSRKKYISDMHFKYDILK